ncbi:MAG: transglutaminase family protein [Pseudomonadota bacterium]
MRLRVNHETRYRYDRPARNVIQTLRLTPQSHDAQYVRRWRVEVDQDVRLFQGQDSLGNPVHHLTIDGPIDALTVTAFGEVEVQDAGGIVAGTRERLPAGVFLRETRLTKPNPAIRALSPPHVSSNPDVLTSLHELMGTLRERMLFEVGTTGASTTGAEALSAGHGVCQDFSHVFIAAARHAGIPARYVSGHLNHPDTDAAQEAGHAWAEALVPDLGWVGFDSANGICVTEHYVRVAIGFDALSGAAIRGAFAGGGAEDMTVEVHVDQSGRAAQRQTQDAFGQSQSQ